MCRLQQRQPLRQWGAIWTGLQQPQPGGQLQAAWQPPGRALRASEAPLSTWPPSGSLSRCLFRQVLACPAPVRMCIQLSIILVLTGLWDVCCLLLKQSLYSAKDVSAIVQPVMEVPELFACKANKVPPYDQFITTAHAVQAPALFEHMGLRPPKGVLLHGPPGTGKTMLACAAAADAGARLFVLNGPDIISEFVGESEAGLQVLASSNPGIA